MMIKRWQQLLLGLGLVLFPVTTLAHVPELVTAENQRSVIVIEDYVTSYAYYGELTGWPHRFEFTADEPFRLYVSLSEPAIHDEPQEDFTVIVIKQKSRGVEEVVRLRPEEASWEAEYEPFGGDTYYAGGEFDEELEPGEYAIEVSTPDNAGKYTLAVGYEEDFSGVGYFGTLGRIYEVKRFFEKPGLAVLQSPFYYVPTVIILLMITGVWWWRRRRLDTL